MSEQPRPAAAWERWSVALDELEGRIEQHRAVLDGALAAPTYHLPTGLGPLPPTLLGRAQELLARLHEVEAEVTSQMAALRSRVGRRPSPVPVPLYLDARA